MTLSELLSSISTTKTRLREKLGISSNALYQYPTYIYNVLAYQFNQGYKEGWFSVKGTAYTGNDPKPLIDMQTVNPTWQGPVTNDLSNLTSLMSAIADIRVAMKTSFANCSVTVNNVFSTYPDAVDSGKTTNYQNGYSLGVTDATSATPAQKVNTPTILPLSGNKYGIYSSNATSLKIWISNTAGGTAISGTTIERAVKSLTYELPEIGNNKYLCVQAFATGMLNSDITSQLMSYVYPEVPVEPEPEVPSDVSFNLVSNNNGTAHMTLSTTTPGCSIKYTFNNWTQTNTIYPNGSSTPTSGTIIITQNLTAGQLKAKAILNGVESEHVTSYQYALIVVQEEEEEDTPQNTPFWIKGSGTEGIWNIKRSSKTDIEISEYKNFSTIMVPDDELGTGGSHVYTWNFEQNKKYYIRTTSTTAAVAPQLVSSVDSINYVGYTGFNLALGGNLQYLSNKNGTAGTLPEKCFYQYFRYSKCKDLLKDISQLYFPDGGSESYYEMFYQCNNLVEMPETITCTIGYKTCYNMFQYCKSITKSPRITASTIEEQGCFQMFDSCTSLTTAGDIECTSIIGNNNFKWMFYGCTALTKGPSELKATSIPTDAYRAMFYGCTKLKNAPIIRATTIGNSSLYQMFYNCSSLQMIEVHFINWNSNNTLNWMYNVASGGTFKIGSECTWNYSDHIGSSGIPSSWNPVYL